MPKSKKQKKAQKKKSSKYTTHSCELCDQIDCDEMVRCDTCDLWYHFVCVGLSAIEENDPWECPSCINCVSQLISIPIDQDIQKPSSLKQPNPKASRQSHEVSNDGQHRDIVVSDDHNRNQDDHNKNRVSQTAIVVDDGRTHRSERLSEHTRSSVRRRTQLELDRIEEERQLQEKRDKVYLEKKYQVLLEDCNSVSDKRSVDRSSFTREWVHQRNDKEESMQVNQSTSSKNVPIPPPSLEENRYIDAEFDTRNGETQSLLEPREQMVVNTQDHHWSSLAKRKDVVAQPNKIRSGSVDMLNPRLVLDSRKIFLKRIDQINLDDENPKSCQWQYNRKSHEEPMLPNYQWNTENSKAYGQEIEKSEGEIFRKRMENERSTPKLSRECPKNVENRPSTNEAQWHPQVGNIRMENQRQGYEFRRISDQVPRYNNPTNETYVKKNLNVGNERDSIRQSLNEPYQTRQNNEFWSNMYELPKNPDAKGRTEQRNIDSRSKIYADPISDHPITHNGRDEQSPRLTPSQIASRQVVDKKLLIFTGNPDDWFSWHKKFVNTTDMCGLNDGENLERLEKCLQGKAREAVRSQLIYPAAVPWIINTLKMLFGRPEVIIKSQINKIRNYPALKADRIESLMEFAFEVQNISATIESLNRHDHLTDPMLVEELVNKLPVQEKKEWARYKMGKSNVTLKTLAIWLYELAQVLSTVATPWTTKSNDRNSDKRNGKESIHVNVHADGGSEQVSFAQNQAKSPKKVYPCRICKKGCEKVENCSKFKSFTTDERWKALNEEKLCRRCLPKHKGVCRATTICGKNECQFKHHTLLHNEERHHSPKFKPQQNGDSTLASSNFHNESKEGTMLRIVPVILYNGKKSVKTYAFLDDGTSISMMEQRVADEQGLSGSPEQLCLIWTNKIHRKEKAERVTLEISGTNERDRRYNLNGIRTVKDLHLPAQSIKKADLVKRYPYLRNVPIEDYTNAVPGIMIGSDKPKFGVQLKVVEGDEAENEDGPIASKTRLGWSIQGPRESSAVIHHVNHHKFEICSHHNQLDNEIHQRVKEYFSIENFGVQSNGNLITESKDDERAVEWLRKFTRQVNGKFETRLLWKFDEVNLPDSYPMAMRRLISLEKQGGKAIKAVGDKIAEYIAKNYAKKLSSEELKIDRPVWYLPPFGVVHPKKPDKLRMVFDAAAKVKTVSLNSMLLKGPDQFTSLIDILRRFRENMFAVCGDIREMYHQIGIRDEDQHFQRFLFRNGESQREPDVYVMKVMTFGATCSPCAAQYVKNFNAAKFKQTHPKAVKAIVDNHYVDDMMDGDGTEEAVIKLVQDVKMIHTHGGFEIRNFLSNSVKVLEAIGDKGADGVKSISPNSDLKIERVLGMWWNTQSDVFTFSLKYTVINEDILNGRKLPTKREILKTLMSIFDPLGLLSNYLVQLKILLQEVWRTEIDWDEQISTDNLIHRWRQWLEILPEVENVKIPRLYSPKISPGTQTSIQIHVFVDASEDAFAAVIYLRVEDENGVDCSLIGSKARVAPLKYLSIPRKELQGSVLGTRLSVSVISAQRFKVDRRIIWTDSATVISWLNSDHRKYSQFVAHRVGEILESSDVNEWRWIPTKENVADEATKWAKPPNFEPSNRWFSGPDLLRLSEDQWPAKKSIKIDVEEEMKAHFAHSSLVLAQIIDPERFSNYNRMLRSMAYVIRFRNLFTGKVEKGEPLNQEDLRRAENLIFRQAQFEGYPSEMVTLERNKILPIDKQKFIEKPSPLYHGTPYLDGEGILRMKGRIDGARELSMDTKRPIVLPKDSRITKLLLLREYHSKFFHQNHETVVNEVRQKFYIPCLRTVLKKTRKDCQMCKVKKAHPIPPQMADLPAARVASRFIPFSFVGIDFFGPMFVMIGKRKEKRWGVLFTCLTIRAVHIEISHGLDTNSCILCIQNFVADHGPVIEFHSDCGTNFKGSDNDLQREMRKIDPEPLKTKFTTTYTKWLFNPPASPHMGGSWERLIRSVKSGLDQIMPTRTPKEDMLRNLLKQIQNVINSRPLTFIPLDVAEDEALTPNHFLKLSSNKSKPPCKIDLDGPYLRESWKESQRLTEWFWKRFVKEYLPTLARRTKWFKPVKPLKKGDLVLIVDENNPRNTYPKARILETRIGSNGQVRRAKVEIISDAKVNSKGQICKVTKTELWRSAHTLALLDVVHQKNSLADTGLDSETGGSVDATNSNLDVGAPITGHRTGQIVSSNLPTGLMTGETTKKKKRTQRL